MSATRLDDIAAACAATALAAVAGKVGTDGVARGTKAASARAVSYTGDAARMTLDSNQFSNQPSNRPDANHQKQQVNKPTRVLQKTICVSGASPTRD